MNEWVSEFIFSLCSLAEGWSKHPFPFNCDCCYWFMARFDLFFLRVFFHLGNFWSGNPPCQILWHIWRCRIIVFLSYSLCTFIVQLKVILSFSGSLCLCGGFFLHINELEMCIAICFLIKTFFFYLWKGTIKVYLTSHMLERVQAAPGRRICWKFMTKSSVTYSSW